MYSNTISAADLVWTLDDCDVVIKKVASDTLQQWLMSCSELTREELDDRVLHHLNKMNWLLHKLLQQPKDTITPGQCSICLEHTATQVLLPCHHLCVCSICVKDLTKCPICTQAISASLHYRVYITRTGDAKQIFFDPAIPEDLKLLAHRALHITSLLCRLQREYSEMSPPEKEVWHQENVQGGAEGAAVQVRAGGGP